MTYQHHPQPNHSHDLPRHALRRMQRDYMRLEGGPNWFVPIVLSLVLIAIAGVMMVSGTPGSDTSTTTTANDRATDMTLKQPGN